MKAMKKMVMVNVALATCMSLTANVSAMNYSGYFYNSEGKIGDVESEPSYSVPGTNDNIYGGDAGVYIYETDTGLPAGCAVDKTRKMTVWVYDYDGLFNADDLVQTEVFLFDRSDSNNLNNVHSCISNQHTSDHLESDGVVELYIEYKVESSPEDKSSVVPEELIQYRFWVD